MNGNIAVDSSKGLRSYTRSSSYVDLSSLTSAEIGDILSRCGGSDVSLTTRAQKIYDKYDSPAMKSRLMLSAMKGVNKRFNSVSSVANRRADNFFLQNSVSLNAIKTGVEMHDVVSGEVSRVCQSNVIYDAKTPPPMPALVKEQFAVRVASALSVKTDVNGTRVLRSDVMKLPDIVKGFDAKDGAQMLLGTSCSNLDLTVSDTVYKSINGAKLEVVSNATDHFYSMCDDVVRKNLTAVKTGTEKFYLPTSAPVVNVKVTAEEYVAKERIKILTTAYPGLKKGPGNYVSSHMDGIPMSGGMRKKFNHVSDVVNVDADVYIVDDHDPIVINALRTLLIGQGQNKIMLYRSNKVLQTRVLRKHAVMEGNQIVKVTSPCCLSGTFLPGVSRDLVSCYITFKDLTFKSAANFGRIVDHARTAFNEVQDLEESFTYVQSYIDYRALSFAVVQQEVDGMTLTNATGQWNKDEKYYPSARMGEGMAWYVTGRGDYSGEQIAAAIATACLHRIQYMLLPMPRRVFCGVSVPFQPCYNFSVASMKKRMPYMPYDDEDKTAQFFDPEVLSRMVTALNAKVRATDTTQEDLEAMMDSLTENDDALLELEVEEGNVEENSLGDVLEEDSTADVMKVTVKEVDGFSALV